MITKEKNTKDKKAIKVKKAGKKKLGMGLSSLLSKDAELSSVIKSKITESLINSFLYKFVKYFLKFESKW